MKSEKYTPASKRQLVRLCDLGVAVEPDITQHQATRLINEVVAALRLPRGQRLKNLK